MVKWSCLPNTLQCKGIIKVNPTHLLLIASYGSCCSVAILFTIVFLFLVVHCFFVACMLYSSPFPPRGICRNFLCSSSLFLSASWHSSVKFSLFLPQLLSALWLFSLKLSSLSLVSLSLASFFVEMLLSLSRPHPLSLWWSSVVSSLSVKSCSLPFSFPLFFAQTVSSAC